MSRISSIGQGPYGVESALEEAGGHGRYQKRMLVALSGVFWIAGHYVMGLAFYLAPPKLICSDGKECSQLEACGHEYTKSKDSVHGIAYEWDLVCDRAYVSTLIGVIYFIGTVLGSPTMSWLADSVGRKRCTIYSLGTASILFLVGGFAPDPEVFYPISFIAGFITTGFGVGTFLLLAEMVDMEHQSIYAGILFSSWSVGTCANAVLFYFLRNWRHVMLIHAALAGALIPSVCTVHESIRWLIVNEKDVPEANRVLQSIARTNCMSNTDIKVHHVRKDIQDLIPDSLSSDEANERLVQQMDPEVRFIDLFRYRTIRGKVISSAILYFANNLCYFGTVFALSTYIGNVYVNGVALGIGEVIPSIVTGIILVYIPRKASCLVSGILGASFCLTAYLCVLWPCDRSAGGCLVPDLLTAGLLFCSMYVFASSFMLQSMYITEMFPTRYRSLAFGMCNTIAKMGGLVSSTLMVLKTHTGVHPLLIVAGCSFLGSLPAFLLPETKGKELVDY